jgi:hypothetical protein
MAAPNILNAVHVNVAKKAKEAAALEVRNKHYIGYILVHAAFLFVVDLFLKQFRIGIHTVDEEITISYTDTAYIGCQSMCISIFTVSNSLDFDNLDSIQP